MEPTTDKQANGMIIDMLLNGGLSRQPYKSIEDTIMGNDLFNEFYKSLIEPSPRASPPYDQPFRQRPPQMEKWFGRPT